MKKIGIDARLYSQTGVGTYLKNLLYYLDKNNTEGFTFYIYLTRKDYDSVEFDGKNFVKRLADFRWHTFSEQTKYLAEINKDNLDMMHFTYFSYPILYRKSFIATVHDATPLLFKTGRASTKNQLVYAIKHFFFRVILKTQITGALRIITPTAAVKKELVSIYGENNSNKIIPIHEGVNYQMEKAAMKKQTIAGPGNFFLYVGNFYPHKNVEKLIEAFKLVKTDSELLLVGPDDYFTNRLAKKISKTDRIRIIKNPGLTDLIGYYRNATALVHPSLSEGFGLPVIEAAYNSCPVIASDIPVFREILGNNFVAFDPNDINDISQKIEFFLKEKPRFDYKNIVKKFSFKKMADETLKIYRELS